MNIAKLEEFILKKLSNELSEKLTYHGVHHTISVLENCRQYIRRMEINEKDAFLLETAALMHDTGYLIAVNDHEERSKEYIKGMLPGWNYSSDEIERINGMIEATKIPQKPANVLEQIIGDSDLDYLGTDAFDRISETLYSELFALNKIKNREQWDELQIRFLQSHRYHTPFAKEHREPVKQKHLEDLIRKSKAKS